MSRKEEEKLVGRFRELPARERSSLLDYLDYLYDRTNSVVCAAKEPLSMERPPDETVIGAMQRLRQTYPMLNTDGIFDRASALMSEHMLYGREANAVIDDLEALFRETFESKAKGD